MSDSTHIGPLTISFEDLFNEGFGGDESAFSEYLKGLGIAFVVDESLARAIFHERYDLRPIGAILFGEEFDKRLNTIRENCENKSDTLSEELYAQRNSDEYSVLHDAYIRERDQIELASYEEEIQLFLEFVARFNAAHNSTRVVQFDSSRLHADVEISREGDCIRFTLRENGLLGASSTHPIADSYHRVSIWLQDHVKEEKDFNWTAVQEAITAISGGPQED